MLKYGSLVLECFAQLRGKSFGSHFRRINVYSVVLSLVSKGCFRVLRSMKTFIELLRLDSPDSLACSSIDDRS